MPDDRAATDRAGTDPGRDASPEDALLDRAFLDAQTFGDAALARELLGLFAAQCGRLVPTITDPARPTQARADAAHTLRGAAQALGAHRVAGLAARVEMALAGGPGDAAALAVALERATAATLAEAAA